MTTAQTTTTAPRIGDGSKFITKTKHSAGIKVRVHIPENVPENVRRQKINRIYDILKPETPGK